MYVYIWFVERDQGPFYMYIQVYQDRVRKSQFQISTPTIRNLQICIRTRSMRQIVLYCHIWPTNPSVADFGRLVILAYFLYRPGEGHAAPYSFQFCMSLGTRATLCMYLAIIHPPMPDFAPLLQIRVVGVTCDAHVLDLALNQHSMPRGNSQRVPQVGPKEVKGTK